MKLIQQYIISLSSQFSQISHYRASQNIYIALGTFLLLLGLTFTQPFATSRPCLPQFAAAEQHRSNPTSSPPVTNFDTGTLAV